MFLIFSKQTLGLFITLLESRCNTFHDVVFRFSKAPLAFSSRLVIKVHSLPFTPPSLLPPPSKLPSSPSLHTLQIQTLRLALRLRLEHPLPRAPKIRHLHPHPALPQRHQPGLGADGLDVRARQVVLLGDKLLEVDVLVEAHLARVQREDLALGVLVRVLEQDLAVDTAGADERRVQGVDLVGGHDHLDVAAVVEAVELVEELEHGALDLALAAGGGLVALGADGVDFVDEDDGGGVLGGDLGS